MLKVKLRCYPGGNNPPARLKLLLAYTRQVVIRKIPKEEN